MKQLKIMLWFDVEDFITPEADLSIVTGGKLLPVRHVNTSYDWAKDWIIFPEGLDASGIVRHALLQTWTLKPALY